MNMKTGVEFAPGLEGGGPLVVTPARAMPSCLCDGNAGTFDMGGENRPTLISGPARRINSPNRPAWRSRAGKR